MAIATVDIRVLDLEPVQRLIEAMAAVCRGAERDGYRSAELAAFLAVLSTAQPAVTEAARQRIAAAQQAVPFRTRRGRCSQ